jgi:outer membrane protein OmpA-like peptidoglycan-associated protein
MKPTTIIITAVAALMLAGCASVPPPELVNARQSYEQAINSPAAQLVPAEVHKAKQALAIAEKSFADDPKSYKTIDLSYIADRKAKMAVALSVTAAEQAKEAKANKEYQAAQEQVMKNTKSDLAAQTENAKTANENLAAQTQITNETKADLATQTQLTTAAKTDLTKQTAISKSAKDDLAASERTVDQKNLQLAAETAARMDAENRAAKSQAALVKLAAVKEEARGLVITLSGSVLFASNKSSLLPAARDRLSQVSAALMETKERKITIEGYTDSQGSDKTNMDLSQKRADAVRSYIISRGYSGSLIEARGLGKDRPVADNATAEGRANNRRVEIIVERGPVTVNR